MTGSCGWRKAAAYLDVCKNKLLTLPIAKANIAAPDAQRACWRWRYEDLDAFLADRTVQPGYA